MGIYKKFYSTFYLTSVHHEITSWSIYSDKSWAPFCNKGIRTQKYTWIWYKIIWKTANFGANCLEIRFLLLKIMLFYVFKMAVNGGRHFEINIKNVNYRTQFISQKHAFSYTLNKCDLCYSNYHFMGLFCEYCTLRMFTGYNYLFKLFSYISFSLLKYITRHLIPKLL